MRINQDETFTYLPTKFAKILLGGLGGFSKILRNFQCGSWQMLRPAYKVGGWSEKKAKNMLT